MSKDHGYNYSESYHEHDLVAWKLSNYGVFSGLYLDTFHTVPVISILISMPYTFISNKNDFRYEPSEI